MKYFGTDGIRIEDLTILKEIAKKTTYALYKLNAKNIVLGKDTRQSGRILEKILCSNLKNYGINVYNLKIVPSSCVAYYTKILNCDYGIVITASHNPPNINGIKIFDKNGEKLFKEIEDKIENYIDEYEAPNLKNKGIYKLIKPDKYKELLLKISRLENKKIVLDCANGAARKIAPLIFKKLGAKVIKINTGSGKKINDNCGAVYPQTLSETVRHNKADFGFAFDGDADRCVCVLPNGKVLSGDNILFAVAKELKLNQVVGTIYANGALDNELKKHDIILHRSDVGDQAVKRLMNKQGCNFGGERSGHFIFKNYLPTGDGILTALIICGIKKFKTKFYFKKFPSVSLNFKTKNKNLLVLKLAPYEAAFGKLIQDNGRIILRASGTEDIIRVLIEHKDKKLVKKLAEKFTKAFEKEEKCAE